MAILKRGSRGVAVEHWQRALSDVSLVEGWLLGPGAIDGVFGPVTEVATEAFQRRRKLTIDGVVGPVTRAAIALAPYGSESLLFAVQSVAVRSTEALESAVAEASERAALTTRGRLAAFLAQVSHESAGFTATVEEWGPTAQQKKYDPPGALARKLGNTVPGDGKRYRGRGPIQLTGRANYAAAGEALSLDLVEHPEQVEQIAVGMRVAGWFWTTRKLNALADRDDFAGITKKINGGLTGYAARVVLWNRARRALGIA